LKVVVTGASGFIGMPVIKMLSDAGFKVLAISRTIHELSEHKNISFLKADLSNPKTYRKKVKLFSPRILIHLAWQDIPDFSFDKSLLNLKQSLEILNFVLNFETCKKIIVSGSCFEINQLKGKCPEKNKVVAKDHFTWAKLSLYSWLKMRCSNKKIHFAWMRIFYVYGPGQRKESLIPSILKNLMKGQLPDIHSPGNSNDFVYVDDVADGFLKAVCVNFPSGIYNLGSGSSTPILDVCLIAEQIVLGDDSLTLELKLKTKKIKSNEDFWADIQNSKEILDWQPTTSLNEGIKKTHYWINS